MDTLPAEMLLKILKSIDAEDVHRLRGLNRFFKGVIDANISHLEKPKIRLKITKPICELHLGQLVIKAGFIMVKVVIEKNRKVTLINNMKLTTKFIDAFYSTAAETPEAPQADLFMNWLLHKFNIVSLKIVTFNNWKIAFSIVSEAMKKAGTKCDIIKVFDECEKPCGCGLPISPLMPELADSMKADLKKTGTTPPLITIVPQELRDNTAIHSYLDSLNFFTNHFSGVSSTLNHKMIYIVLHSLLLRFCEGAEVNIKFSLWLDYTNIAGDLLNSVYTEYAKMCLRLDVTLLHITRQQFFGIAQLHRVPQQLVFQHKGNMRLLSIGLQKEGAKICVSVHNDN